MYFAINKANNGEFYYRIVGGNYETMAVSETFTSKASAESAINVIKRDAASATILDMTVKSPPTDRWLP